MLTQWMTFFGDTLTKPALSHATEENSKAAKLNAGRCFMLHCIVQPSHDRIGQYF